MPSGSPDELERIVTAMTLSLAHRGPDDHGLWSDAACGVSLGHRRLSILDLSPAGHQPMRSADGRFVTVYNGEIYNHAELRADLAARSVQFRGHSDTETMLEAFSVYGVAQTITRLIGMFAMAVWDRRERSLTLVRDRLGIKPLYWAKFGGLFLLGSELKALRAHPGWSPRIDRRALASFLRHSYVPAPLTIYEGVHKLEPGCMLVLPWGGEPRITRYWDAREIAQTGLRETFEANDAELTERLEALLIDAVRQRMIADVPVGAFLSGGVDSSTVVALMKAANAGPVRTYSIGFDEAGYNEAAHAAAIARHLGTDHTELTVTASQALDVVPYLPEIYDEPFADSSQIPTYLISKLTRQHVTVALSGDGGDELFAGYSRHQLAQRFWRTVAHAPRPLRRGLARLAMVLPAESLAALLPPRLRLPQPRDKLQKIAAVLGAPDEGALYRGLVTQWDPAALMPGIDEPKGVLWDSTLQKDFSGLMERMQLLDLVTYLPDDILTKVDRASMAVGLEARVPLLDHRVVEFSWRMPRTALVRNGMSKWPLRQVLYRHVPRALIERPKMGFAIPLDNWLRGPLRSWAETCLSETRLRDAGLFDPAPIRRAWHDHLAGRRNVQHPLWNIIMFEAWRERWGSA